MPLRVGLTYTQMKLGRAHEHLGQLKVEVDRFIKSKPYTEWRYDDPQNARHVICVEQKLTPDTVGTLVGEFAYNVRSSLDHLAWQLALLTTDKPSSKVAFPVAPVCPSSGDKRFEEKIAGIPPQAVKVIEDLQPYTRWPDFKTHPIWQINKLCNLDKHQVIAVSSADFRFTTLNVSVAMGPAYPNRHTPCVAIPLSEKSKVDFHAEIAGVIFGEPIDKPGASSDFEIGLDGLEAIYQFVRYDAVPRFEKFFP